jgi:mannose-6-phosphate isomerase-like protein (cupin superfamily)
LNDKDLIERLFCRFDAAADELFCDRIQKMQVDDCGFKDADGTTATEVTAHNPGTDKSGAGFQIFRLGWANDRLWELVMIDGAYVPHRHKGVDSEFFIFTGQGYWSCNQEWREYQARSSTTVDRGVAHGFVTDPRCGPTVFLSIQSSEIWNFKTNAIDFEYADHDGFPIPRALIEQRKRRIAKKPPVAE